MAGIEPVQVNPGGPGQLAGALASVGGSIGSVLGNLGAGGSVRAQIRSSAAQRAHEASQAQLAHQHNLEVVDKIHIAGKSMDVHKQELKERDREHMHAAATKFVTQTGTAVRGGSRVDLQETAEGGHRISFTAAAAKRKSAGSKAGKADAPAATAAPAASTPKSRSSAKTEVIKVTNMAPGEQYND